MHTTSPSPLKPLIYGDGELCVCRNAAEKCELPKNRAPGHNMNLKIKYRHKPRR